MRTTRTCDHCLTLRNPNHRNSFSRLHPQCGAGPLGSLRQPMQGLAQVGAKRGDVQQYILKGRRKNPADFWISGASGTTTSWLRLSLEEHHITIYDHGFEKKNLSWIWRFTWVAKSAVCCVFPTLQPFVFQKKVSQPIAFRFSMESQSPSSGADASPTSTLVAMYPLGTNLPGNSV